MLYYKYIHLFSLRTAVLLGALSALCSCDKTLVETSDKLGVAFSVDWSAVEPKVSQSSASIYVYPVSDLEQSLGNPVVLSGVDEQGAATELPTGSYRVIVHNEDIDIVKMRGHHSHSEFESYVDIVDRSKVPITSTIGNSGYGFITSVDNLSLLTGSVNREVVISGTTAMNFVLRPRTATKSYLFNITVPTRLGIESLEAVLDGVASKMDMFTATPKSSDLANIAIPIVSDSKSSKDTIRASGKIEVFGVDPSNRNEWSNTLHLHLVPTAVQATQIGSRTADDEFVKDHKIDLTDHFNSFTNTNLIIDVKLDSPDPTQGGEVTFEVTVREWIIEEGGDVDLDPTT